MHQSDPRRYMDLVRSLRQGRHDKVTPSDTAGVSPEEWFQHFRQLLGSAQEPKDDEQMMRDYIDTNCAALGWDLDQPITKDELLRCVRKLKN